MRLEKGLLALTKIEFQLQVREGNQHWFHFIPLYILAFYTTTTLIIIFTNWFSSIYYNMSQHGLINYK